MYTVIQHTNTRYLTLIAFRVHCGTVTGVASASVSGQNEYIKHDFRVQSVATIRIVKAHCNSTHTNLLLSPGCSYNGVVRAHCNSTHTNLLLSPGCSYNGVVRAHCNSTHTNLLSPRCSYNGVVRAHCNSTHTNLLLSPGCSYL